MVEVSTELGDSISFDSMDGLGKLVTFFTDLLEIEQTKYVQTIKN